MTLPWKRARHAFLGANKAQPRALKAPAAADRVMEMIGHCPDSLAWLRDRALLLLGFAGAFRCSELVALSVADLEEVPEGLRVYIRRSNTDQEGEGYVVAIPRGSRACPVAAVPARLAAACHQRRAGVPPDGER